VSAHDLCRMTMTGMRADANKLGVKIPKGLRCESAFREDFYIYDRRARCVWEGAACCKWEARTLYFERLIREATCESPPRS
jgi:hypothetical protein